MRFQSTVSFLSVFIAKICTINVRGFGNAAKQDLIFDYARSGKYDFVCVQETLAARPAAIDLLRKSWSGPSFWSPALGKQGGVCILVSKDSPFKIEQWKKDSSGRLVSLLISLGKLRFNLVNIYAPTNVTERKPFYDEIHDFFFPSAQKIIAGDFNSIESSLNKFGGSENSFSATLRDFRALHDLIDIW